MMTRLFGILWGRMIFMLALLPVLAYAIIQTHARAVGPLQDALWEELPGITHVAEVGYNVPTPLPVILNWGREIKKEDLLFLQEYTRYLRVKLPHDWKVASLANYQVRSWDGEDEEWGSYASSLRMEENFSMETWKENVRKNKAVYGSFVSTDFHYLTIMVGYPASMDQLNAIRAFRRVMQRQYPLRNGSLWENAHYYITDYLDTDFVPYREPGWPEILVGSLSVTEALITWAFFVDVDIKVVLGYVFLLLPFLFMAFGEMKYALSVWVATLFAFLATLASIAPLSLLGMRYSVFLLPTLVGGVLIASVSFNAQMIEEVKRRRGVDTYSQWQEVVRTSVRTSVNHIFRLTLFCFLIFGFAYQSLWTAIVMDTVLVMGSMWAWLIQRWLLPAFYFFFLRHTWRTPGFLARVSLCFENAHGRLIGRKVQQNQRRSAWSGIRICALLLLPIGIASAFVCIGRIDTNSRQTEFLGNRHARIMLDKMTKLGRLDVIPIMFEETVASGDSLGRAQFYEAARSFMAEAARVKGVGNITSGIGQVAFEMERDDGLAVPYAKAVTLMREGAGRSEVIQWTEWKNAVLMYADHPMDSAFSIDEATGEMQQVIEKHQALHKGLVISLFGGMLHYSPLAKIIAQNALGVLVASLAAVFLYYSWMARKECVYIPAFKGGAVISQGFLFVGGVIVMFMGICEIPLNIATAAIIPVVIGAASDANVYPAQEFFFLLRQQAATGAVDAKNAAALALSVRGKAVDIDCMGNILVLSLLLLSSFSPVWNLGLLACVSLGACRWWSVNFTLPQMVRLYEKHNLGDKTAKKEVRNAANSRDTLNYLSVAPLRGR